MANPRQPRNLIFGLSVDAATAALAIAFMLIVVATQAAQAQTFSVLHNFTGRADGGTPLGGVTIDRGGNLYGTAEIGGTYGGGTVYQLKYEGSGWIFNTLYSFRGGSDDGALPYAGVTFGPNGTLYGTTALGGPYSSGGTVFNLSIPPSVCKSIICPWTETVLHYFGAGFDGINPAFGQVVFDQNGNLYGTTDQGGNGEGGEGAGAVYELTPLGSGWTESVLHAFGTGSDGIYPYNDVILDSAGNLYGTTYEGGSSGYGMVFELSPSGSGWTEKVLYNFQDGSDGSNPVAGLILDPSSGDLYGATADGYYGCCGTVFKLTPSDGGWTYSLIYRFTGGSGGNYGAGPYGSLAMDGAGNLYGTTFGDGAHNNGSVFELTPSGNSWTYTALHDFTGSSDGGGPYGSVTIDREGNLYGTTSLGGTYGNGVVWEITP